MTGAFQPPRCQRCNNAGRLSRIDNSTYAVGYQYLTNSPLVEKTSYATLVNSNTPFMTRTDDYDELNRLRTRTTSTGASWSDPWSFGYNQANQRIRSMNQEFYWDYGYDTLGQVTSASKHWGIENYPLVAGQQFQYGYDQIGNRTAPYAADRDNEYTQRTMPGTINITGMAYNNNQVTVNGQSQGMAYQTTPNGRYFQMALSVPNQSAAVDQEVSVALGGGYATLGWVVHPKQTETFQYDADGNLTSDSLWTYTWDAENRLIAMVHQQGIQKVTANGTITTMPRKRLEFTYDYLGRRIRKVVFDQPSGGNVILDHRYVYDGWNLLAELSSVLLHVGFGPERQ